jgi:SAM-dependent methyltransferase
MIEAAQKRWDLKRLRIMADNCPPGLTVDLGFMSFPNPFLKGRVVGLDLRFGPTPRNYMASARAAAEALPLAGHVEVMCAGELIEHVADPLAFLVECNRALKPGGALILSSPNPYHAGEVLKNLLGLKKGLQADTHLLLISYRSLHKLLGLAGFEVRRCYGTYLKIPGLPLRIPSSLFPTISHNIIVVARKTRSVRLADILPGLRKRYRGRFRKSAGLRRLTE